MSAFSNVILLSLAVKYICKASLTTEINANFPENFDGQMYKQMDMEHLLLEDSLRQSEFEEFLQSEQWHQTSSSSSQRSLSTSSPECSIQAYDQYQNVKFPTLKCEDMIIKQAISTIFSTSVLDQSLRQVQMNRSLVAGHSGFKPYNSTIPPKSEPKRNRVDRKWSRTPSPIWEGSIWWEMVV